MRLPERLVVRFNGVATGYDLTTPERRRYDLRTAQDWVEFRMSSVTRALNGLSLNEGRSLGVRNEGQKIKLRRKRKAKSRKPGKKADKKSRAGKLAGDES